LSSPKGVFFLELNRGKRSGADSKPVGRISMMANRFGYENYYGRVEEASRWRQRADQMRGRKSARGPVELPPQPK
jgi:hypothetical protein